MNELLTTENLLIIAAISLLIPGAVTLLTKVNASDGTKNLVHALVAALAGVGFNFCSAIYNNNSSFSLRNSLVLALVVWGGSTFSYLKAWKNSSTNAALGAATAGFGLGLTQAPAEQAPAEQ